MTYTEPTTADDYKTTFVNALDAADDAQADAYTAAHKVHGGDDLENALAAADDAHEAARKAAWAAYKAANAQRTDR